MNANHHATRLRSLARKNKTENDSRLLNNNEKIAIVSGIFIEGRSQTLLYFPSGVDILKKDRKKLNLRTKLADYYPKQDDHRQQTLKHRNKQNRSKSTNHKP